MIVNKSTNNTRINNIMSHIQDHLNNVSRQCFDTAIITDNKGNAKGKVIVRYTDSQMGFNNETGVIFHHNDIHINCTDTRKGSAYNQYNLYDILSENGCKVLGWNKEQFFNYGNKPKHFEGMQNIEGISSCKDMRYIKVGNSLFKIHWI